MTANEFRKIALALPDAVESAHVNHPDFRVGGKIFATLGYPDNGCGVVKLTPEQQGDFIGRDPDIFEPVSGGWGKRGSTVICLSKANALIAGKALRMAWGNVAPKRLRVQHG